MKVSLVEPQFNPVALILESPEEVNLVFVEERTNMKPSEVFRRAAEYLENPTTGMPFACYAIKTITGNFWSFEQELFYCLYYHESDAPRDNLMSQCIVPWWRDYDKGPRILALLFAAEFYEEVGL